MNTGKLLLIGALGGMAAGILMAPDKGSRTRRKIMRKGENIRERLDDTMDGFSDKLEMAQKEVKGIYKKAGQKVKEMNRAMNGMNHAH